MKNEQLTAEDKDESLRFSLHSKIESSKRISSSYKNNKTLDKFFLKSALEVENSYKN